MAPDTTSPSPHQGGDPTLRVECWHLDQQVERVVRGWFAGQVAPLRWSGDRSVHVAAPDGPGHSIKIKGAGFQGGAIRFGTFLQAGPPAPLFDFDGRAMEDVALGHNGACVGGASAQQVITEWRVTRAVQRLGHDAVPCLGYGKVSDGVHSSWFSVFAWDESWIADLRPPAGSIAAFRDLGDCTGEITLELARDHGLIGFFWMIRTARGKPLMKDLHPFRRADPVNMSQISWVMQTCYALHVTAINTRLLAQAWYGDAAPDDAPLWLFRPLYRQVTLEDWDRMRFALVAKYMLRPHPDFSPEALMDLLEANPITARLLELCPPDFARLR